MQNRKNPENISADRLSDFLWKGSQLFFSYAAVSSIANYAQKRVVLIVFQ